LPEPPTVQSVIIQPVAPSQAVLLAPLPAITAWTPPEKAAPKEFVLPGRPKSAPQQPALDAPPQIDSPNREARLSDVNMTGLASNSQPSLPRPPSSTAPVRVFQPPKPQSAPASQAIGALGGDPAALITAGAGALPPGTYVSVPAVVQRGAVGVLAPPPPRDVPPVNGSGAGQGAGGSSGQGNGGSGSGTTPSGNAPPLNLTPGVARPLPPGVTRVVRPRDGRYTFSVMGSRPDEAFPESAGMLSGDIVFTVYLRIGASRDWVLQYCLPRSAPQGAIERGGTVKIEAPYALLMLRPAVTFQSDDDYLFVRGVVNRAGQFEQLAQLGEAEIVNKELLLSTLRQWEFRPALRDGQPVAVEALLIIPRQDR
jgi:hypothetical protein